MSEEETKYYINITKEKLEGLDSISVELSDDEEIEIGTEPNEELESGKKISIISSDDYSALEDELNTISTNTTNWINTQAMDMIRNIFTQDFVIPYASTSGALKKDNETVNFSDVKRVVDTYSTKLDTDSTVTVDGVSINAIANIIYPVGSIYMSANDVDPSLLFGGEWEKIEGKFLLSSYGSTYTLGSTGGEANHTLTVDEMPSHTHTQNAHTHKQNEHNHTQNSHNHTQNAHYHAMTGNKTTGLQSGSYLRVGAIRSAEGSKNTNSTTATNKPTTATNNKATATNQNATATNQNTGKGYAHNNMPPYLVVHMWKRIV